MPTTWPKAQAGDHVGYLPGADESIQKFTRYHDPRRLYQALCCISRAADAWNDDVLGNGFADYFRQAGYEFSSRNPAGRSRKNRSQYQTSYNGRSVLLESPKSRPSHLTRPMPAHLLASVGRRPFPGHRTRRAPPFELSRTTGCSSLKIFRLHSA